MVSALEASSMRTGGRLSDERVGGGLVTIGSEGAITSIVGTVSCGIISACFSTRR